LTLTGEYGARTTLKDSADPTSSVLYVAAPVMVHGRIAGVLTVAKPTTNINTFLKKAKPQIFRIGLLAVLAAVLLSLIVSYWITLPIKRLTRYAKDIGAGKRAPFPELGRSEIGEMGNAFEEMKEALEGKKYVEQYVQTLTHEIKSPLSAIRGAAELLEEKMRPEQRARFLANIHNEVNRIQDIVDRLLELAALENLKILKKQESLSFHTLVKSVLEGKRPIMSQKQLTPVNRVPENLMVKGDSFLLHQALSNLVQNAIDFSPPRRQMELSAQREGNAVRVKVEDNGPGIPDYALEKVFDKFFSLERPDTRTKSTGLGLNFVKEVAMLHGGDITLTNRPEGGVTATMTLPVGGGTLQKDKISLAKND
jgi:two-component system sensor histidine kinase CreC